MDAAEKKRNAAKASLEFIEPGMTLGVGTGSTVNELIELLPTVKDRIDKVVSSSKASTELLEEKGFEVATLNEVGPVDIYIDGADEANKRLHLIKGGGGALTKASLLACLVRSRCLSRLSRWPRPTSRDSWSNSAHNRSGAKDS
jgi:ribose 5-phosphate isomerase A